MESIDSEVRINKEPQCVDEIIQILQETHEFRYAKDNGAKDAAMANIVRMMESRGMSTWYRSLCETMGISPKADVANRMETARESFVAESEQSKSDEERTIDAPSDESLQKKIIDLFNCGKPKEAVEFAEGCMETLVSNTSKIEVCFLVLRIGILMNDSALISKQLLKVHQIFENYTNWEQRNRLSVYEGVYKVSACSYSAATELFLSAISTYRSPELMQYPTFLSSTVMLALATLDRPVLKKMIIDKSEIMAMLEHSPETYSLLKAFDECKYARLFESLASACEKLKMNAFFHSSVDFVSREIEIRAFNQYLEAYQTVHLSSMASAFDLQESVLEQKLFQRISDGRVFCKIDKVAGHAIAHCKDELSATYREVLERGSRLQSQLQHLSRVLGM
mmetsp:Transcript_11725/g.17773  ORF Transcript_11725/g.17773 Transcript_11725/m.17773 type:complete len:394 (-) Transcript_11725:2-1183(-)